MFIFYIDVPPPGSQPLPLSRCLLPKQRENCSYMSELHGGKNCLLWVEFTSYLWLYTTVVSEIKPCVTLLWVSVALTAKNTAT